MTGYTRQETLGRNCNFIQGPSTLTDTIQQFSFLLASAQCGLFEIMNYRKDGTPFWNLVYVEPICDQYGLVDKFFGVQVDISDVLDRHHDRSKSKFYDDKGLQIGPIRHADAKAIADVKLLEDGSVQVGQFMPVAFDPIVSNAPQANSRFMRPFLGDRHVIDLVQQAVHSGTASIIETRFPNRSGPSMLFVRSSPAVKTFVDSLQVPQFHLSLLLLLHHVSTFLPPFSHASLLQCDALMSIESATPLPKDQRDMKVVQVCSTISCSSHASFRFDFLLTLFSVPLPALVSSIQKACTL